MKYIKLFENYNSGSKIEEIYNFLNADENKKLLGSFIDHAKKSLFRDITNDKYVYRVEDIQGISREHNTTWRIKFSYDEKESGKKDRYTVVEIKELPQNLVDSLYNFINKFKEENNTII